MLFIYVVSTEIDVKLRYSYLLLGRFFIFTKLLGELVYGA